MKTAMGLLLGIAVFKIDESLTKYRKQIKFPRSKRKRIRKKWAKNERNFESGKNCYFVGNRLYADKETIIAMQNYEN